MTEAFLNAQRHQGRICPQAAPLIIVAKNFKQPAGDEMSGGFLTGTEQQEDH
jgi:hypothetical protein